MLASLLALASAAAAPEAPQPQPPVPPRPPAHVLLLGTFHFDDKGLDAYKPEHRLDVLSPERQREIEEVARCLERFRPTKVAIEAMPSDAAKWNERFRAYVAGTRPLGRNEIDQLGLRVARSMGHSQIYAIDADGRYYPEDIVLEKDTAGKGQLEQLTAADSGGDYLEKYAAAKGQLERLTASETPWEEYYTAVYRYDDQRKTRQSIRQTLLQANDPKRVLLGHGHYLLGTFKIGVGDEYPGVDAKTAWYNRNLRIFANIQRITEGPSDRILVIVGSGHLAVLSHAVEASPEYELVPVAEILGPACDAAGKP